MRISFYGSTVYFRALANQIGEMESPVNTAELLRLEMACRQRRLIEEDRLRFATPTLVSGICGAVPIRTEE